MDTLFLGCGEAKQSGRGSGEEMERQKTVQNKGAFSELVSCALQPDNTSCFPLLYNNAFIFSTNEPSA